MTFPGSGSGRVHADIDALKGFHEALVRFRHVQRGVAQRGDDEIELTRASLAAKASFWQFRLEQSQAELDACRAGRGADCSGYARAVEQAVAQLEHIRGWQLRVDEAAVEFRGPAGAFTDMLQNDLPRAEGHLVALIADLEAARRAS